MENGDSYTTGDSEIDKLRQIEKVHCSYWQVGGLGRGTQGRALMNVRD